MYKLNFFNFQERENNYLITNDFGKFLFIDKINFNKLINKEQLDTKIKNELIEKILYMRKVKNYFLLKNI